jgi:hypothetical protein
MRPPTVTAVAGDLAEVQWHVAVRLAGGLLGSEVEALELEFDAVARATILSRWIWRLASRLVLG